MQTFPKNISQNFAYILDPNTFPGKANPFSQFILVFGGVPTLRHLQMLKYLAFGGVATLPNLQSILMNVFRPMCYNFTHSSKFIEIIY